MTVAHYVLLGRTAHLGPLGRESRHDLDVVDRALTQLDLDGLADRTLDTLSGGERQRTVLARGLAQEATLLFLDEPTAALDIAHQQETLELVDDLRRRLGLTVVSTMHDLTLAAQYADHLVLLTGGRIILSGPAAQVLTGQPARTPLRRSGRRHPPPRQPRRRPVASSHNRTEVTTGFGGRMGHR